MDSEQTIQIIGAFLILCAFVMLQIKRLKMTSLTYLVLNLVGAVLLGIAAVMTWQWGFIILEVVWAGVALWGIIRKYST